MNLFSIPPPAKSSSHQFSSSFAHPLPIHLDHDELQTSYLLVLSQAHQSFSQCPTHWILLQRCPLDILGCSHDRRLLQRDHRQLHRPITSNSTLEPPSQDNSHHEIDPPNKPPRRCPYLQMHHLNMLPHRCAANPTNIRVAVIMPASRILLGKLSARAIIEILSKDKVPVQQNTRYTTHPCEQSAGFKG